MRTYFLKTIFYKFVLFIILPPAQPVLFVAELGSAGQVVDQEVDAGVDGEEEVGHFHQTRRNLYIPTELWYILVRNIFYLPCHDANHCLLEV